ncbi:MAG: Bax inhibitor-1/YccA family protein [Phycisphaerae bacterium]|jgi:hypothetical protein|nr:Bax inhibitor-1/YccA family protein [Phycisphaerae bacterium]
MQDMRYDTYAGAKAQTNTFVTAVFGWMTGALAITAIVAMLTVRTPALRNLIFGNQAVFFGLLIAELVLVIALIASINRISATTAAVMLIVYSALNGLTISMIMLIYTATSITSTFFVCASIFGVMCGYGAITKRDLSGMGSLCIMGLIGVIIASVVNVFVASSALYWGITYIGVFVFVGLTAYDMQKIKRMASSVQPGTEVAQKAAVIGALHLYLDFINLFLLLLRIMGRQR